MNRWKWAERCHTVPSPLVGEGRGEGYNLHCIASYLMTNKSSQLSTLSLRATASYPVSALSLPPSLSLPHKGGGNRGARIFATHAMCLWADFQPSVGAALPMVHQ